MLNVIAPVHIELLHGRRDFGHQAGLIAREERAVAVDNPPDGRLRHGGDLHRGGRPFLFLRLTAGREKKADKNGEVDLAQHG